MKFTWAVSFALLPLSAAAGPDDVSRWLMNDPVSMLDWGMYRIDSALNGFPVDGTVPGGQISFNWDMNLLTMERYLFPEEPDDPESLCAEWVRKVRSLAGINAETGKAFGDYSFFSGYFAHLGFDQKNAPKDLYASIDRMLSLRCVVYDKGKMAVVLTAPLVGKTYSVERGAP